MHSGSRTAWGWRGRLAGALVALGLGGCASEASTAAAASGGAADTTASADSAPGSDTAAGADASASQDTAPAAPQPPVPAAFAGTCPDLQSGSVAIQTGGFDRSAQLYLPAEPKGAGVLFLWHGLGDSAKGFAGAIGAKNLAEQLGVIVVVPNSCCAAPFQKGCCNQATAWNFAGEFDRDLSLFDGLISCLDQQHAIDRARIYSSGFSAGALWTTFLLMNRGEVLAAAGPMSGGVNGFNPWTPTKRAVPVIDTSGGPTDTFGGGIIDFQASTEELNTELRKAGHFVVHCQHKLGHTVPPDMARFVMEFLVAHRWDDATSPMAAGLPAKAPSGCNIVP